MSKVHRTQTTMNVVDAARLRLRNIFSNGVKVYMAFSGGKDSLCLAQLTYEGIQAGELDPRLLTVIYVDEEGMYPDIIDIVTKWRARFLACGAAFDWLCLEFRHFSCLNALTSDESFILWDHTNRENWIRTPPPFAVTFDPRLTPGKETYQQFFSRTHNDGVNIDGVRMAESYQRVKYMSRGMTGRMADGKGLGGVAAGNRISPLYDWTDRDVWLFLREHGVEIPISYLYMWQIGIAKNRLRISQFFSVDTIGNLYEMSQFYPELMDRVCRREPNAYLAMLYYDTEMFRRSTRGRRELEKSETPKNYRALLEDMLTHIHRDFHTEHARRVAMNYRSAYLNFAGRMSDIHLKRMYEGLKAGDPKTRTLRGVLALVTTDDIKQAGG